MLAFSQEPEQIGILQYYHNIIYFHTNLWIVDRNAYVKYLMNFNVMFSFQLDHEFIAKGYIMKKGRIKVTVFKMYKVSFSTCNSICN